MSSPFWIGNLASIGCPSCAPTLMINGWWDFGCPVEACQMPMLRLLGAREQGKKLV